MNWKKLNFDFQTLRNNVMTDKNSNRVERTLRNRGRRIPKRSNKGTDRSSSRNDNIPPVMVRAAYESRRQPSKAKRKQKIRRRFDISLSKAGSRGVEMRLPSLPVIHPGWRVLSLLLLVSGVLVLNYLLTSPTFKVKSVRVEGLLRMSVDDVSRTLGVMDKAIFTLDPEKMEEKITESYVELTNVSVQVNLPADVLIQVNERVPMIAWVMENKTLWIDGNGFIFSPRGEAEKIVSVFADVLPPSTVVDQIDDGTGSEIEDGLQAFVPEEYINAVFELNSRTPKKSRLIFDKSRGFGWADPRGWKVFFGTEIRDIESKLQVYYAVVEKLEGEGITPDLISVAYLHAPYYR